MIPNTYLILLIFYILPENEQNYLKLISRFKFICIIKVLKSFKDIMKIPSISDNCLKLLLLLCTTQEQSEIIKVLCEKG